MTDVIYKAIKDNIWIDGTEYVSVDHAAEAVRAALRALDDPLSVRCPVCHEAAEQPCRALEEVYKMVSSRVVIGTHVERAGVARQQLLRAIYNP